MKKHVARTLICLGVSAALGGSAFAGGYRTVCDGDEIKAASHCAILDEAGREILLRGVNARIKGVFDVDFNDGRKPLEHIAEFTSADTDAMRKIGFYFLRVPIQWSAIEPEIGKYDKSYIERIGTVLDLCQKAGIKVMVDMHQDAYSKEIGEDGAPLWAIIPPPETRNKGGHLDSLLELRISKQTQKAFASFWRNTPVAGKGLQDRFIDAMMQVVERYKSHPALLGMEIFNEPWLLHANSTLAAYEEPLDPPLSLDQLNAFYAKAMPRMAKVAPDKLIFFEPDVVKNFPHVLPPDAPTTLKPYSATAPDKLPWDSAKTVYAPHFYVAAFFDPGNATEGFPNLKADNPEIDLNMKNSVAEARAFKAPLMFGEFGFTEKSPQYGAIMAKFMALADQHAIHTAQWVWKENSQDAWGFFDFKNEVPILREKAARDTARAYPLAVSGRIQSIQFDPKSAELNLTYRYAATGKPHELFLPSAFHYSKGHVLTCDGKPVKAKTLDKQGRVEVACGGKPGQSYVLKARPK